MIFDEILDLTTHLLTGTLFAGRSFAEFDYNIHIHA